MNRKFYHKNGFGDETNYINWCSDGAHCVQDNGVWDKAPHITLNWLLACVEDGTYEERE